MARSIHVGAALLLLLSAILLPEVIGAADNDYDPLTMFLSELGADGMPYAAPVNYLVFPATGLLTAVLLVLAAKKLPRHALVTIGLVLCLGVSIGYGGAAAFPCEPGCPVEGGLRQSVHNSLGLFEYGGATLGLAFLTVGLKRLNAYPLMLVSGAACALVVTGFAMMLAVMPAGPAGLWQRIADYGFFLWLALVVLSPSWLRRESDQPI